MPAQHRHRRQLFWVTLVKKTSCAAALILVSVCNAYAASRAPVAARHGMVVTAQHLATEVGVDVLKRGGNAIDAAVAVGYALAVTYPAAGNIGGGGFMTIQLADGRRTFIDFRETAPLAATRDMYLDKDGNFRPESSARGFLAAAVPGTVAGLEFARKKYGTRSRQTLIKPAIDLAQHGFVLDDGDAAMLHEATDDFRRDPASAAIFMHASQSLASGQRLIQRDLARTLRSISTSGTDGFYRGPVAAAIAAASRAGGGIITRADMAGYRARELPPVEC